MRKTVALALPAALVILLGWLRLEDPQRAPLRAAVLVALAVAPALVRPIWARGAAIVVAVVAAAAGAFRVSPRALWPGDHDAFFSPIVHRFGGAFADFYEFRLPVDPAMHARMEMVLLFAAFAFVLLVSLAIAARRPVLTVVVFLVGAGWPATLLAGGHEVARGVVILAAALLLLAGVAGRATAVAFPAAAVVVLAAVALTSSPAVAKSAFLDWQHWNPVARPVKPVNVRYVWDANYDGIAFPKKVTTVLHVRASRNVGTYWRATVLDSYVGGRWLERVWRETAAEAHQLAPPAARDPANSVHQDVTVDALADRHLIAASAPVAYNISEPATYVGQDVALATDGLKHGEQYIAWSYIATPTPAQLVRSQPDYPEALIRRGRDLEIGGIDAPPFGQSGRDDLLARKLVGSLAVYRQLFDRARAVAGNTHSPYAAVVALERWFRTSGGFHYSTTPPQTPGVPPLVAFALETKRGYCQHFAGAMALMSRLLGIPARIGVGFVRGRYDNGEWVVTDHDAHAWVEVWFRGYGWLPFDPTPGRGRLAAAYSAASSRFDVKAEAKLLSGVVKGGEVFGALTKGENATPKRGTSLQSAADVGVRASSRLGVASSSR
jgi:transglutaminase-like putative cysteine protease